jgi:hypothetical protein
MNDGGGGGGDNLPVRIHFIMMINGYFIVLK